MKRRRSEMRVTAVSGAIFVAVVLVTLTPLACEVQPVKPPPRVNEPIPAPAPRPHVLERIAVVGASATAGFGAEIRIPTATGTREVSVELADVLGAGIIRSHEIAGNGDFFFFTGPVRVGTYRLKRALAADPTLVVAVDYLFWFSYGLNDAGGEPLRDEDARLDLLEEGLALLDQVECPIVVGDIPDMSAAVGLMLSARQVPSPESLDKLNARLREWADGRSHVTVVPLAGFITRIGEDRALALGPYEWPAGSASVLLLYDHLHPSPRGLIATAQLVAVALVESGAADAGDFDLDPEAVLRRLRERNTPDEPAGEPSAAAPSGNAV